MILIRTEKLAKKLMEFKTVSPAQDAAIFEFLKGYLEEKGVDAEVHNIDGVKNLTAETGDGEPSICFNGHLDVVEPGTGWEVTEPFEPVIKDGKIYGRGATDMKAGAAAEIKAFLDLHEDPEFEGSATLMLVGDEEIGGENGTKPLVDSYYESDHGFDYVLVGEPTDLDIQVATRGVFWVDVYLRGDTVHASRVHKADQNVLRELPKALESIKNIELSNSHNELLPDPTVEVTTVSADDTYNSLPAEVHIGLDIRYVPEQKSDEIMDDLRRELADLDCEIRVEPKIDHGGAFELEDEKFKTVATEELEKIIGRTPEHITDGGASDGRFFAQRGTQYIELGLNQEMVHREDEYCKIDQLRKMREAYYRISKRLASDQQQAKSEKQVKEGA